LERVATEGSVMRGSTSLDTDIPAQDTYMIQREFHLVICTAAGNVCEQQAEWLYAVSCLGLALVNNSCIGCNTTLTQLEKN